MCPRPLAPDPPAPGPRPSPQLDKDEALLGSLRDELRKALVQSLEVELGYVVAERDALLERRDANQARLEAELAATQEEIKRLREQVASAQGAVEALRQDHQVALERAQRAEAETAEVRARASAAATATAASAAPGLGGSGALVAAGGPGFRGGAAPRSSPTDDADQEFMNADLDHDGGCGGMERRGFGGLMVVVVVVVEGGGGVCACGG